MEKSETRHKKETIFETEEVTSGMLKKQKMSLQQIKALQKQHKGKVLNDDHETIDEQKYTQQKEQENDQEVYIKTKHKGFKMIKNVSSEVKTLIDESKGKSDENVAPLTIIRDHYAGEVNRLNTRDQLLKSLTDEVKDSITMYIVLSKNIINDEVIAQFEKNEIAYDVNTADLRIKNDREWIANKNKREDRKKELNEIRIKIDEYKDYVFKVFSTSETVILKEDEKSAQQIMINGKFFRIPNYKMPKDGREVGMVVSSVITEEELSRRCKVYLSVGSINFSFLRHMSLFNNEDYKHMYSLNSTILSTSELIQKVLDNYVPSTGLDEDLPMRLIKINKVIERSMSGVLADTQVYTHNNSKFTEIDIDKIPSRNRCFGVVIYLKDSQTIILERGDLREIVDIIYPIKFNKIKMPDNVVDVVRLRLDGVKGSFIPLNVNGNSHGSSFYNQGLVRRETFLAEVIRALDTFELLRSGVIITDPHDVSFIESIMHNKLNSNDKKAYDSLLYDGVTVGCKIKYEVHNTEKPPRLFFPSNQSAQCLMQMIFTIYLNQIESVIMNHDSKSLYSVSPSKGEFGKVMLKILEGVEPDYLVYSDNLFIWNSKNYASLDVSSMEANHTFETIYYTATLVGDSIFYDEKDKSAWIKLCQILYIVMGVKEALFSLEDGIVDTIPIPFMPSGVAGTSLFNHILMSVVAYKVLVDEGHKYSFFGSDGSVNPSVIQRFLDYGIVFTVTLLIEKPNLTISNNLKIIEMDFLGYDAWIFSDSFRTVILPILGKERIIKSIVFDTIKDVDMVLSKKSLVQLIKVKAFFLVGLWAYPDLAKGSITFVTELNKKWSEEHNAMMYGQSINFQEILNSLFEDERMSEEYVTSSFKDFRVPTFKTFVELASNSTVADTTFILSCIQDNEYLQELINIEVAYNPYEVSKESMLRVISNGSTPEDVERILLDYKRRVLERDKDKDKKSMDKYIAYQRALGLSGIYSNFSYDSDDPNTVFITKKPLDIDTNYLSITSSNDFLSHVVKMYLIKKGRKKENKGKGIDSDKTGNTRKYGLISFFKEVVLLSFQGADRVSVLTILCDFLNALIIKVGKEINHNSVLIKFVNDYVEGIKKGLAMKGVTFKYPKNNRKIFEIKETEFIIDYDSSSDEFSINFIGGYLRSFVESLDKYILEILIYMKKEKYPFVEVPRLKNNPNVFFNVVHEGVKKISSLYALSTSFYLRTGRNFNLNPKLISRYLREQFGYKKNVDNIIINVGKSYINFDDVKTNGNYFGSGKITEYIDEADKYNKDLLALRKRLIVSDLSNDLFLLEIILQDNTLLNVTILKAYDQLKEKWFNYEMNSHQIRSFAILLYDLIKKMGLSELLKKIKNKISGELYQEQMLNQLSSMADKTEREVNNFINLNREKRAKRKLLKHDKRVLDIKDKKEEEARIALINKDKNRLIMAEMRRKMRENYERKDIKTEDKGDTNIDDEEYESDGDDDFISKVEEMNNDDKVHSEFDKKISLKIDREPDVVEEEVPNSDINSVLLTTFIDSITTQEDLYVSKSKKSRREAKRRDLKDAVKTVYKASMVNYKDDPNNYVFVFCGNNLYSFKTRTRRECYDFLTRNKYSNFTLIDDMVCVDGSQYDLSQIVTDKDDYSILITSVSEFDYISLKGFILNLLRSESYCLFREPSGGYILFADFDNKYNWCTVNDGIYYVIEAGEYQYISREDAFLVEPVGNSSYIINYEDKVVKGVVKYCGKSKTAVICLLYKNYDTDNDNYFEDDLNMLFKEDWYKYDFDNLFSKYKSYLDLKVNF